MVSIVVWVVVALNNLNIQRQVPVIRSWTLVNRSTFTRLNTLCMVDRVLDIYGEVLIIRS